jgi:hypothetical protein
MSTLELSQSGPGPLRMLAESAGLSPARRQQYGGYRDPHVHGGRRARRGGDTRKRVQELPRQDADPPAAAAATAMPRQRPRPPKTKILIPNGSLSNLHPRRLQSAVRA